MSDNDCCVAQNEDPHCVYKAYLPRCVIFVALLALLLMLPASGASADPSNMGLGPNRTVPAWSHGRNVHFFAPRYSGASLDPALGPHESHTDLGRRCETGYCPQPPLQYKGGPVQHGPTVYLIFWGSNFNNGTLRTETLNLFNSLSSTGTNPSYQGILTQYWDGSGSIGSVDTVAGNYIDTRVGAPAGVSQTSVEEEVAYSIAVNHWPQSGVNPQYVVLTPSGATYQRSFVYNAKGEAAFCGYHERTGGVSYSFIPSEYNEPFYLGCAVGYDHSGPNGETLPNHATTMVASHEYAESATDPEPTTSPGWQDSEGYEIGDICASGDDELPGGSWVQGLWGNRENACVLQDPPYSPPPAPSVTTEGANSIQYRQANITGSVNPNGVPTNYHFEYGTTTSYGTSTPEANAGYGTSSVGEGSTITGLKPGTTYHYRLVASSWVGTSYGGDREFTTPIPPPAVTTEAPSEVGEVHATLNAAVNPEEFSTTYQLEYWENGKSGEVARIPATPESVGAGATYVKVHQHLTGLKKATEYIYRVTATNAGGTSRGAEVTFVTGPFLEAQTTPNPSGGSGNVLRGVACASASACVAVGEDQNSAKQWVPLAESWDGGEWQLRSVPLPTGATEGALEGVSCSSATACTAVGHYHVTSTGENGLLAERWNGSEWTVQTTPAVTGKPLTVSLTGVSCTSATSCVAVGYYWKAGTEVTTIIDSWNGSEWKAQASPSPKEYNKLTSVSCTSASACTAVGTTLSEVLVERWNGTEWTVQTGVSKGSSSGLAAVACTSATACSAIGFGGEGPLAESWNGTTWTSQSVPTPSGGKETALEGLSCSSPTSCFAAGSYTNGSGVKVTLGDTWNGTEWREVATPNPAGAIRSRLYAASCPSASECAAVGQYESSAGVWLTLAEAGP